MSRRLIIIGTGAALVTAAALTAAIMTATGFLTIGDTDPPTPPEPTIPAEAYTPGEATATITVGSGGRLKVQETIVFDALDGRSEPLTRVVGPLLLGWQDQGDERYELSVEPAYSELEAVELVRDGKAAPLRLDTAAVKHQIGDEAEDESAEEPDTEWRIRPRRGEWSPGRHAIRITYSVEDVHVTYNGGTALLVPLPQRGLADVHVDLLSVTVRGDGMAGARCSSRESAFRGAGLGCGKPLDDAYRLRIAYDRDGLGDNSSYGTVPDREAIVYEAPALASTPVPINEELVS